MKKFLSVLLAAVLALSMVACGGGNSSSAAGGNSTASGSGAAASGESLKVGFSLPSMTFPFYVRMYEGIMESAEELGWEVTFADGNLDATTQLNGLQDMINNNVDVIIAATWWIDAMADIFSQCEEKGIPVFLMDNMTIPGGYENAITFSTGTDNLNAGIVGGIWMAGYLADQGKSEINMVYVSSQSEQQIKRCTGFVQGLEDNGITVNLLNTYDGGEREKAMRASEDALTAFADLELIYGASAQDSLGAFDATAGANRSEVMVIGFDGEDEELEKVDAGGNYIATVTQDPRGQAALVVEHVQKWQAGESFEQLIETPAGVYCAEGQLAGDDIVG